jgi:alkylhydroperoxidase family enzyme
MTARIPPVPFEGWPDEITAVVHRIDGSSSRRDKSSQRGQSALGTLAHHPALAKVWLELTAQIMRTSTLSDRQREILVLRTVVQRKSQFQWVEHMAVAARCGLEGDEVARIAFGPDAPGWDHLERALLLSVDELLEDGCISTPTWELLAERLDAQQILDVIFTIGATETNCWMARSFALDAEAETPPL